MRPLYLFFFLLLCTLANAQGVAIGSGTPTPAASAILDLQSTTQGLLPPRMTTAQRTGIASPATGLVVYDTTVGTIYVRTASAWVQLGAGAGSGWSLTGNAATDTTVNYIGTSDNKPLIFRSNNLFSGCIIPSNNNTAFGYQAMKGGHAGTSFSVAVGSNALAKAIAPAASNTAIGANSLQNNTTGFNNTAEGAFSLGTNSTGANNVAVGSLALSLNATGSSNVAMGRRALYNNTSGFSNIAIGPGALESNILGQRSIAIGDSALFSFSLATESYESNVAIGHKALWQATVGLGNTAVGYSALGAQSISLGHNTALGALALAGNIDGVSNTACGYMSLHSVATGDDNTGIGNGSGPNGSFSNTSALGKNSTPTASNRINIGTSSNNNLVGVYGAVQNLSDGRFKTDVAEDVPGLAFIAKLRPVTYHLDVAKVDEFVGVKAKVERSGDPMEKERYQKRIKEVSAEKLTGFIAQEVEQAAKEVGYDFDGVQLPKNDHDHYTLGYSTFVVPLVKAVQEQQAMIEEQRMFIKAQAQRMDDQAEELRAIRAELRNLTISSKTP